MNDDGIDGLLDVRGAEIARLRAENRRLRDRLARMQAARSELRDAHAHFAYVELVGKSTRRAENGRNGRSPRIELNAAIRAVVAAGLDAVSAGNPETLDGPRSGASEGDPPRQDGPETS